MGRPMIDLQKISETIELPLQLQRRGDRAVLVDIPMINIHQHKIDIDSALKRIGQEANDIRREIYNPMNPLVPKRETWGEYLKECVVVWQCTRVDGSLDGKSNSINYGQTYFENLDVYLATVSDTMHEWLLGKINDFKEKKILPDYDRITIEQAESLVEALLSKNGSKKKTFDRQLDIASWNSLRSFITTLASQHVKLHQENLQNIGQLKQLEKQNESLQNTKSKKK